MRLKRTLRLHLTWKLNKWSLVIVGNFVSEGLLKSLHGHPIEPGSSFASCLQCIRAPTDSVLNTAEEARNSKQKDEAAYASIKQADCSVEYTVQP